MTICIGIVGGPRAIRNVRCFPIILNNSVDQSGGGKEGDEDKSCPVRGGIFKMVINVDSKVMMSPYLI